MKEKLNLYEVTKHSQQKNASYLLEKEVLRSSASTFAIEEPGRKQTREEEDPSRAKHYS